MALICVSTKPSRVSCDSNFAGLAGLGLFMFFAFPPQGDAAIS